MRLRRSLTAELDLLELHAALRCPAVQGITQQLDNEVAVTVKHVTSSREQRHKLMRELLLQLSSLERFAELVKQTQTKSTSGSLAQGSLQVVISQYNNKQPMNSFPVPRYWHDHRPQNRS